MDSIRQRWTGDPEQFKKFLAFVKIQHNVMIMSTKGPRAIMDKAGGVVLHVCLPMTRAGLGAGQEIRNVRLKGCILADLGWLIDLP